MPNYIQPNSSNPTVNPAVTVQPHQAATVSGNPLQILAPIPRHIEPGIDNKLDPRGSIRAGRSGS